MKIFFISTPKGDLKHIAYVYETITKLGHTHTSDFAVTVKPELFYKNADEEIWRKRYEQRLEEIANADVAIFEISFPSFGAGQLAQEAIRAEKPVILLYFEGNKPNFFRGTAQAEKRVQLFEYTHENLKEILTYGLGIATDLLTTRFTMLMPSDMTKYLETVKNHSGLSRSEYIRKLLKEDMEKSTSRKKKL